MSLADVFDGCDLNARRMIISQLIDGIYVSKGYRVEIRLNVTLHQYLEYMNRKEGEKEDPMILPA
mgnify:FL=1